MKHLFALLLLCATVVPVSAKEIDLSSFASGNTASHSCLWTEKHDATSHWQECSLCGTVTSESQHTFRTSYTIGETSCSSQNQKVMSCSGCDYISSTPYQNTMHTFIRTQMLPDFEGGDLWFVDYCSVCTEQVWHEDTSDSSGNVVTPAENLLGQQVYDYYGETLIPVTNMILRRSSHAPQCIESSLSGDGKHLNLITTVVSPQVSNTVAAVWVNGLLEGKELLNVYVSASAVTYDSTNQRYLATFSLPLGDLAIDRMSKPSIAIQFSHKDEAISLVYDYFQLSDAVDLSSILPAPTIEAYSYH